MSLPFKSSLYSVWLPTIFQTVLEVLEDIVFLYLNLQITSPWSLIYVDIARLLAARKLLEIRCQKKAVVLKAFSFIEEADKKRFTAPS